MNPYQPPTPYEILRHNLSVIRNSVGSYSYTIAIDFERDTTISLGGICAMINNDVSRMMENEPYNNARQFFGTIRNCVLSVAKKMGEGHENFDEVYNKAIEWCEKNNDPTGIRCPYKFYFTTYCKQNKSFITRWLSKLNIVLKPHQFVIHVIRDSTLDNRGGYFIQIHAYHDKATYVSDEQYQENKDKFFRICDEKLRAFSNSIKKTPIYYLTDPSVSGRLRHWMKRCYARYNGFIYSVCMHIKHSFTGSILDTNK